MVEKAGMEPPRHDERGGRRGRDSAGRNPGDGSARRSRRGSERFYLCGDRVRVVLQFILAEEAGEKQEWKSELYWKVALPFRARRKIG